MESSTENTRIDERVSKVNAKKLLDNSLCAYMHLREKKICASAYLFHFDEQILRCTFD